MNLSDSRLTNRPIPNRQTLVKVVSLAVILVAVLLMSYIGMRARSTPQERDAARLSLETLVRARQVYAIEHSDSLPARLPLLERSRQALLSDLQKLAKLRPEPRTIRRLALMQRSLGDPGWKASLARLRDVPRSGSAFGAERELALWDAVLGGNDVRPEDIPSLHSQLDAMDLGWYEHIALESLYKNAHMTAEAAAESKVAQKSAYELIVFWRMGEGVARLGVGIGLCLLGYLMWRKSNPEASVPTWLKITPPAITTHAQSDALYRVFLTYLSTYAVFKLIATLVIQPALGHEGTASPIGVTVSVLLSLASAVVPYIAFKKIGSRIGLNAANMGFRSKNVAADIGWGITGFAMALPLVWIATALSALLFRGYSSPLHPAIAEFTGTRNLYTQVILLSQAAIIAPMVEETLFRGVFYRSLSPRLGWVPSMLLTSAVFAILHPQLPFGFLGLFVLGSVFNLLYALRGSLLPSVIAHSINNASIFYFAYLVGS